MSLRRPIQSSPRHTKNVTECRHNYLNKITKQNTHVMKTRHGVTSENIYVILTKDFIS